MSFSTLSGVLPQKEQLNSVSRREKMRIDLTRTRSAAAGDSVRGFQWTCFHNVKQGITPAGGRLHRMVRRQNQRFDFTARNSPLPTGTWLVANSAAVSTKAMNGPICSACDVALSTTSRPPGRRTRLRWGHQSGYLERSASMNTKSNAASG